MAGKGGIQALPPRLLGGKGKQARGLARQHLALLLLYGEQMDVLCEISCYRP